MSKALCWLTFLIVYGTCGAADAAEPLAAWQFVPEYWLPGHAKNQPGPRVPAPEGDFPLVMVDSMPMRFRGDLPTQRLLNLAPLDTLPKARFSVEAWLCHHVNQPVGAVIAFKGRTPGSPVSWALGFHAWESSFTLHGQDGSSIQLSSKMKRWGGFKERWIHLVAAYDGKQVTLFVNGEAVGEASMSAAEIAWPADGELELAAYMQNEPHMQWSNLVHAVRLYNEPLDLPTVQAQFKAFQDPVEQGQIYPDLFHYTAGPYLNFVTQTSINVVWETDRPATALIEWGKTDQLGHSLQLSKTQRLQEATLEGLLPNTPYFYRVRSTTEEGYSMESGLLTFKTAVRESEPFRFAVIGDTESRPHVNDRLCKLIWGERPNFLVNLGDLTDGGKAPHRYEWTHEYFVGMTQLVSRVPVFAVPGNGEGDLVWYKHYHRYPDPEGFYKFRFGDAEFFMLDSNQREKEFAPGGRQYVWLEKQLQDSDAKWKFACHHHATYTGEENDYGDTWSGASNFGDPAVRQIVPLYEKYGVDMVMFGHLHLYERSLPIRDGQVDFQAGTIHLLGGRRWRQPGGLCPHTRLLQRQDASRSPLRDHRSPRRPVGDDPL